MTITEADVLAIAHGPEPSWGHRNHRITAGYDDLSLAFGACLDTTDATWTTFAAWSSKTLGVNIRDERFLPPEEQLLARIPHAARLVVTRMLLATRALGDRRLSRQLALGNRWVFAEIGTATARFIAWFGPDSDPDPRRYADFAATLVDLPLSPGEERSDDALAELVEGFRWYHEARYETDPVRKAQCVLAGNLLLGGYEQRRVDPWVRAAFGAPIDIVVAPVANLLTGRRPGAAPPDWVDDLSEWFLRFSTAHALVLVGPEGVLRLGSDLPAPHGQGGFVPEPLRTLPPEIQAIVDRYDRSDGDGVGTAATNWASFDDRMNYIANLFRSRQQRPEMSARRPFSPAERIEILAGRDPFDIGYEDPPALGTDRVNDAVLDRMRLRTDPEADAVVDELLGPMASGRERSLLRSMVHHGVTSPDGMAADIGDAPTGRGAVADAQVWLAADPGLPDWADEELIALGQRFYQRWGLQVNMALLFSSLPEAYGAARGVRVLDLTSDLVTDPTRRIAETTQLVLDVMAPGGLAPGGQGRRSVRGVRMMHAGIRHLIRTDPAIAHTCDETVARRWCRDEWGDPINQEDLLGTMCTFSWTTIETLRKVGVPLDDDEVRGYVHLWCVVASLLGVEDELLPLDLEELEQVAKLIRYRQQERSLAGIRLTEALVNDLATKMPFGFRWMPETLVRIGIGDDRADMLAVGGDGIARSMIETSLGISGLTWLDDAIVKALSGGAGRIIVRVFLASERQGARPAFRIPDEFVEEWNLRRKRLGGVLANPSG
ncbi:MAG: oxygenase MpaB family protein [Actinomycetota bacterium]|nr:oxygenase MpaB family protein [Actinomycetota bacterium]